MAHPDFHGDEKTLSVVDTNKLKEKAVYMIHPLLLNLQTLKTTTLCFHISSHTRFFFLKVIIY